MALIRWEPAREMRSTRNDLDRLFASVFDTTTFGTAGRPAVRQFAPALDIVEAEGDYVIKADLPGVSEHDVALEVQDGILTISGQRRDEREHNHAGYHRLERASGSFSRSLSLPEGVTPEAVSASFDRGVLEIHVPKPEQRKPRKIEIAVGAEATPVDGTSTPRQLGDAEASDQS
jgi:HSP20 family protein